MAVTWKMTRVATAETRTLEGWGILSARRDLANLGRDTLTLGFGLSDIRGNSPFEANEILRLDRVVETAPDTFEATVVFRGRAAAPRRFASGPAEGFSIIVSGPWWYLENVIYTQPLKFVTAAGSLLNPTPASPDGLQITDFPIETRKSSRILLNTDQAGARIGTRVMIIDALTLAIAKGAPIAIGTIDPGISITREELADATCAEIILKCLRWTPDHSSFWDYSVDPPALHIRTKANRALLIVDVDDLEIEEVDINAESDAMLSGVTINFLRRHQRSDFEFLTLEKQVAGPSPEGIGALILTIELYGSYLVQTAAGPPAVVAIIPQEATPAGIAGTLYNAFSAIAYSGRLRRVSDEAEAEAWTSKTLRVLNGVPDWSDSPMTIQGSSDDIFAGRTELLIGPPRQLGPMDLVGLVRKGRTIAPPITDLLDRNGGTPRSSPFPTRNPDPNLEQPRPPDPPHTNHAASDFGFPGARIGHSGAHDDYSNPIACGSAGYPACPSFDIPITELGADPSYAQLPAQQGSFGAQIQKTAQWVVGIGPNPGQNFSYSKRLAASGVYSDWIFDFRDLRPETCVGIELVGERVTSLADGTNRVTEERINLSAYIGSLVPLKAVARVGDIAWNGNVRASTASGSVSYPTLRKYLPV